MKEKAHNELAPAGTPQRMNDKWLGNKFLLNFNFIANHGG
jgi:hypothetical protein